MESDDKTALYVIIGKLTVQTEMLRASNRMLQAQLRAEKASHHPAPAANEDAEA